MRFEFIFVVLVCTSCYEVDRDCKRFKLGSFSFETKIDGAQWHTNFVRNDTLEISTYNGKVDSAHVQWVNDCEYILRKLNPKSVEEKTAVHVKILSTNLKSYTFEYSAVGDNTNKRKGVAYINP